ncbi:hypothetical protein OF113_11650 [Ectopseudomonas chengduensis]|nr:hypothetical protein [Pseudomonas chengduensis]UZT80663.1 hypothetical protein OF113_11650 [Pseudomonas chengduensis]
MSSNIEKFDRLAGRIFADLYESFPIPLPMFPTDYLSVVLEGQEYESEADSGPDSVEAYEFFEATYSWLEKAGFIDIQSKALDGTIEAVLTNKALEALKVMPESLSKKESLGDRLAQATRDGVTDQIRSLTGQVLGAGLRFGMSAMQGAI